PRTLASWTHVVEPDQINVLALSMLRNFEQIDDTEEARLSGQLRSDIGEADRLDGIDFDLALVHWVAPADFDVRAGPDSDAAGNVSTTDSLAQALGEDHEESLHPVWREAGVQDQLPRSGLRGRLKFLRQRLSVFRTIVAAQRKLVSPARRYGLY